MTGRLARTSGSSGGFHAGLAVAAGTAIVLSAHAALAVEQAALSRFVLVILGWGLVYLGGVVLVLRRQAQRYDLALILLAALVMRGMALTPQPNLSTDAYRYVWDGRLQAAGINPYLHVPADPRLAHLRDTAIYPNINQKDRAVTIYPPAAQLVFRFANSIGGGLAGVRMVMVLFDLATIAGLLALLHTVGRSRELVLIYAWHPLPIWEFVAQSHVDAAATTAIVFAMLAAVRGRQALCGAIMAAAVLIKYFPAVLLPALWRRWDWRMPAAFTAMTVLLYLPFIGQAGWGVLGFLGHHLDNEGYGAGWGFHPVWLLRDLGLGDPSARVYVSIALLLLAGLALHALFGRRSGEIRFDRLLLLGGAFVFLTSPHYPWYFGFLVALLVLAPQAWGFAMTLLAVVLYVPRPPGGATWTDLYLVVYWAPFGLWLLSLIWAGWRHRRHVVSA